MKRPLSLVAICLLTAFLTSCGGGGEGNDTVAEPPTETPTTPAPEPTETPDDELTSVRALGRVCDTGEGFGDLPVYDPTTPGPHPIAVLVENEDGVLIDPGIGVPRDWTVGSSDVELAELVACGTLTERTPNGGTCDFTREDGTVFTLDLVDVTYDLEIFETATGEPVGSLPLEASSGDCPTGLVTSIEEGQAGYFNVFMLEFDDPAVTAALEPYVTP
ncbi:MAG: hypothetical protein RIE08_10920 [Acidimicrobiales bacterium]